MSGDGRRVEVVLFDEKGTTEDGPSAELVSVTVRDDDGEVVERRIVTLPAGRRRAT